MSDAYARHANAEPPSPPTTSTTPLKNMLTIGEVSHRSGLATSAIRFYESRGFIHAQRTSGNQRRYPRHTLRRLAVIRAAQNIGIPLSAILEAFTELPTDRAPNAAEWQALSSHWRGVLDRRIQALEKMRDGLDGCIGCGCLSLERCPVYNPGDVKGQEGPGARSLLV